MADIARNAILNSPSTRFEYFTVSPGRVKIVIFDVKGRTVRVLADAMHNAGSRGVVWDGKPDRGMAAETGEYFARMEAEGFAACGKMHEILFEKPNRKIFFLTFDRLLYGFP